MMGCKSPCQVFEEPKARGKRKSLFWSAIPFGARIDHFARKIVSYDMALLNEIQAKILRREYEFSRHAVDQSIIRGISVAEVEEAMATRTEVVEDYPDDKYGPSCLILGFTKAGRPIHLQCSYPSRPIVKVITLYEPDPGLWVDLRTRKPE